MKSRKKLRFCCGVLVMLAMVLTACQTQTTEKKQGKKTEEKEAVEKEDQVSEDVQAVIEVMMTAPNEELLFAPSVIGEGTDGSEENEEEVRKQNKETREKWEEKIGTCFSEDKLTRFLESGPAFKYLLEAAEDGSEIRPEEMILEKRSDYTERVRVQYRKDGETKETMLVFTRDSDGKIAEVAEEGADAGEDAYEPRKISREEFLSAYAAQEQVPEEEAAVILEEQHQLFEAYGIQVADYNIVYEERMKDQDVGDGLTLTAVICTEILVDKESGAYVSYGVAAAKETKIGGNVDGLDSFQTGEEAWTDKSGEVIVDVKGQALFQTDGTRTFTKTDIHPAGENTYQYDVDEQFVFTL